MQEQIDQYDMRRPGISTVGMGAVCEPAAQRA